MTTWRHRSPGSDRKGRLVAVLTSPLLGQSSGFVPGISLGASSLSSEYSAILSTALKPFSTRLASLTCTNAQETHHHGLGFVGPYLSRQRLLMIGRTITRSVWLIRKTLLNDYYCPNKIGRRSKTAGLTKRGLNLQDCASSAFNTVL